jgi:hypothetical protein
MTRSPSSASATSSARRRSGGISSATTGLTACASVSAGRPESWASSPTKRPGEIGDDRLAAAELVAARDRHCAGEHDAESVARFAGRHERFTRAVRAHFAKPAHPLDLLGSSVGNT